MFFKLSQIGMDVEVVFGDDTVVGVVRRGIVTFQRESMSPMTLRDVLYVPGLKNNLISVSTIEDVDLECTSLMGMCMFFPWKWDHLLLLLLE